ncbi:hypothetical protein M9H77_23874 [Catharanthus roseus]|uniref:Uncharacterized protein n=1 Tax=Catharanthus roseus TaxID=4058 RepID=A0ACC0AVB4_CATRO|nr:hypothetical protein M9H77_23874 [Catharanthus roseus]
MLKTKNVNVGREGRGEAGESSRGGKKGMGKQVARSETPLVFQYFNIPLFGPNDHIGISKIYNQNTFKRMEFSKNEEGKLMRGGQEEDSENSEVEEEEEGNDPKESDSETEVERIRRETSRKKRQERTEEGQSSVDMLK